MGERLLAVNEVTGAMPLSERTVGTRVYMAHQ